MLWLAGDDQVTLASGKVAAWGDLSSAGNSAVQGNVAQQPTVSPTLVNGHKTVRFTPCNYLTIPDTPSLQFGTGGFTLAIVASYTNAVDAGAPAKSPDIFVKQALTPPYQGILLRGNNIGTSTLLAYVQSGSQVESVAGMNTGALHRIVVRRTTPTQLDLRVDGVSTSATITSTDVSAVGFTARIGGLTANSECLQGDIAEMVVVNTGVSGADAIQLETYFKTKFGL